MTHNTVKPRIYVACLAAYNHGYLHGCWIDATLGEEHIANEVNRMLSESPIPNAEEWAIHDFEGLPENALSEYTGFREVFQLASFIEEFGALGAAVLDYYEIDEAREAIEDYYHGEWESELDYAIHFFDDVYLHDIPEFANDYIDYDKFASDLFINDCFSVHVNGSVHVFSNY